MARLGKTGNSALPVLGDLPAPQARGPSISCGGFGRCRRSANSASWCSWTVSGALRVNSPSSRWHLAPEVSFNRGWTEPAGTLSPRRLMMSRHSGSWWETENMPGASNRSHHLPMRRWRVLLPTAPLRQRGDAHRYSPVAAPERAATGEPQVYLGPLDRSRTGSSLMPAAPRPARAGARSERAGRWCRWTSPPARTAGSRPRRRGLSAPQGDPRRWRSRVPCPSRSGRAWRPARCRSVRSSGPLSLTGPAPPGATASAAS
jgi:hypothetical protein